MEKVTLPTENDLQKIRDSWARWVFDNEFNLADAEFESEEEGYWEFSSDGIQVRSRQLADGIWRVTLYDTELNVFFYGPGLYFDEDLELYFPDRKVTMFFDSYDVCTGMKWED